MLAYRLIPVLDSQQTISLLKIRFVWPYALKERANALVKRLWAKSEVICMLIEKYGTHTSKGTGYIEK
jgi:hypothetical protein